MNCMQARRCPSGRVAQDVFPPMLSGRHCRSGIQFVLDRRELPFFLQGGEREVCELRGSTVEGALCGRFRKAFKKADTPGQHVYGEKLGDEGFPTAFKQDGTDGADETEMVRGFMLFAGEFDVVRLAKVGECGAAFPEETVFPIQVDRSPRGGWQCVRADEKALVFGCEGGRGSTGGEVTGNVAKGFRRSPRPFFSELVSGEVGDEAIHACIAGGAVKQCR